MAIIYDGTDSGSGTIFTFGRMPDDVLTDSFGNVLYNVSLDLYGSQADADEQANLVSTATTDRQGRWSFTHSSLSVIWVRNPAGDVWPVESREYAINPAIAQAAAQASATAASVSASAAQAAQVAAESAVGEPGPTGPQGPRGIQGEQGESAYEVAVDNGFVGTEQQWLDSLKGEKGDPGDPGGGGTGGGDVYSTRVIGTTGGLQGGGNLSADRTLSPVYGTVGNTVCQGNDARLSDARTPLAHTHAIGDVSGLYASLNSKANTASPTFTGTVSGVTKGMVGLGNVDNTSDLDKPVSTATQAAIDAAGSGGNGTVQWVLKKNGVWPSGWSGGVPDYTNGQVDSGIRPTSDENTLVFWKGADPSPAIITAGTGGMLDGIDVRLVTP